MYKLGILGVGKMGGAILNGIVKSKYYQNNEIMFYTKSLEKHIKYQNDGFVLANDALDLFKNSQTILIAIKPQMFSEVLECAKGYNFNGQCVISIAAGKDINTIKSYFNSATIVRAMPNTPSMINYGSTTICTNNKDNLYYNSINILKTIGTVTEIEEEQMDISLPLNGSMPAFLYLFAKGFIEKAIKYGIDETKAKELCSEAIIGSAKMILESNLPIDTLIDNVCSKGGVTLEGLSKLNENNFTKAIDECYEACIKRAKELNNK